MTNLQYEAIVIGSGATGGIAALTLAEKGIKVLVIEAGPKLSAQKALGSEPINMLRRISGILNGEKRIQAQHPGFWKTNPLLYQNEKENPYTHPNDQPFIWTQGRQVGGRSLTWGGITLRLSQKDLKAAQTDGYGPEWPLQYSDLAPHYSSIEKFLGVHGFCDGLNQLPDGEYLSPLPFTQSEEYFSKHVSNSLKFPFIHSRGFGPHQPENEGDWPRSSSPGSTLKKALRTGNVTLLSNHVAERLIINQVESIASGVLVIDKSNGLRKKFEGKLIVICASTIQTIRLLLNSEKKRHSDGFSDPSGRLGSYLMDHISICRFFSLPKTLIEKSSSTSNKDQVLSGAGSFFIPFGTSFENKKRANFIRGYGIWGGIDRFEPPKWLKTMPETSTGFLIGHGEVLPYENNRVTLSDKVDSLGLAIPHISCKWRENEIAMADHMTKTIHQIIESTGGKVLPLTKLINLPFIDFFLKDAVALKETAPPPGYYIHEVGGAPMGTNEQTSVLDPYNRLWRCPNVLVVDGACWPTSAWQSPTLTMMAISRRACLNALNSL